MQMLFKKFFNSIILLKLEISKKYIAQFLNHNKLPFRMIIAFSHCNVRIHFKVEASASSSVPILIGITRDFDSEIEPYTFF